MVTRRPRWVIVLALAGLAAAAGSARANVVWRGETSQAFHVNITHAPDGTVVRVTIPWQASCTHGGWLRSTTVFRRPRATARHFADAGPYSFRLKGGYIAQVRTSLRATRTGGTWRGRLRLRATVRKGGRVLDRCHVATRFSAARPTPRNPQPLPSPTPTAPATPAPPPEAPKWDPSRHGPGAWTMRFDSDPLNDIGPSDSFAGPGDTVTTGGGRSRIAFTVFHRETPGDDWKVDITAGQGANLETRRYENVTWGVTAGRPGPGIEVLHDGHGCSQPVQAEFTITRLDFAGPNEIDAADLTFSVRCGAPGDVHVQDELRGTLRYRSKAAS